MRLIAKLLGATLVVLVGAAAGWQKAARARKRVQVLRQLEQLLARIEGEIRYRATPLPELLKALQQEKAFPALELARCISLRQFQLPAVLTNAERQSLEGFFTILGQTTGEESEREGVYYQKRCAELLTDAQREACTAEGLYTKLGLCCGALLALLLV